CAGPGRREVLRGERPPTISNGRTGSGRRGAAAACGRAPFQVLGEDLFREPHARRSFRPWTEAVTAAYTRVGDRTWTGAGARAPETGLVLQREVDGLELVRADE